MVRLFYGHYMSMQESFSSLIVPYAHNSIACFDGCKDFLASIFYFQEANTMSIIAVKSLTFCHDGSYDNVFENVSFQLDTDWKTGFIGRNGRGKTTFLNLLLGRYPYHGQISAPMQFDYFPFYVPDKTQLTLHVIESITDAPAWQINKELSLLDVSEDVLYRSFDTLSNGEQTKVLLGSLFLNDNHFLLIDEPTNHLDIRARAIVGDYLKSKHSFILVSHDRAFLDYCIDHVLCINKTNIEVQKGNFSSWFENKSRTDHFELSQNEKLESQIKSFSTASKRTAAWSDKVEKSKRHPKAPDVGGDKGYIGRKAAKMMKRSKSIEDRAQKSIAEKSSLLRNIETADELKLHPLQHHLDRLVTAEHLSVSYDGNVVCTDISFEINRGDRIALYGKNGSGKSSLLKLLLGQDIPHTGTLTIAKNLVVSYLSQDTAHLQGILSEFAAAHKLDQSLFQTILRKLDFERTQFDKPIQSYSGGQKKKVILAKSLCEKAHLYVWDEPLNFIDVLSRLQIEEVVLKYCPTMIFIEHDKAFAGKIATSSIHL